MIRNFCCLIINSFFFILIIYGMYKLSLNDDTKYIIIPLSCIAFGLLLAIISFLIIIIKKILEIKKNYCYPKKKQIIELTEIVITDDNFIRIISNDDM